MMRVYQAMSAAIAKSLASFHNPRGADKKRIRISAGVRAGANHRRVRTLCFVLIISLLVTSSPGAPQAIQGLARDLQTSVADKIRGNYTPVNLMQGLQQSYVRYQNWVTAVASERFRSSTSNSAHPTSMPPPLVLSAPSNLTVNSTSSTVIQLSWAAPGGIVNHYLVERSQSMSGPFNVIAQTPSPNYADNVTNGIAYLYRVRAVDSFGASSPPSTMSLGTAISFADPELNAGVSEIKAQHIYDLRQAIDAVRALAELSAATWTDGTLTGGVPVQALHVRQLRDRLGEALTALSVPVDSYEDANLATGGNGTRIRKIHIEQLRLRATRGTSTSTGPGPTISDSSTARLDPANRTGGGGEDPLSRNFNWSVPLVGLPGRAGLDLGLSLSYNSLVWTRSGSFISFDDDRGFPSPGFRLGFPVIQSIYFNSEVGKNAYLLITPDGSRIELRQVGATDFFEAGDASHLLLNRNTMRLRSTNGTELQYVLKGNDFQCAKIKDRNGNFIDISYTSFNRIDTIVDTLGRTIDFNYNQTDNTLTSITQTWAGQTEPKVWASFDYTLKEIQTNFSSSVTNLGLANGTMLKVLRTVTLNTHARFDFDYTTWGQVSRINNHAADGHLLNYRSYNLPPNQNTQFDDCPRFTERRDWAENWNRTGALGPSGLPAGPEAEVLTATWLEAADASWTLPDGTPQSGKVTQVTRVDGTYIKTYFASQSSGAAAGWLRGLVSLVETFASTKPGDPITKQKAAMNKWTQDLTNVSYLLNPRKEETRVYEYNAAGQIQNRSRTSTAYESIDLGNGMTCHLPSDFFEYQADISTVLRRTHFDYNTDPAYISRRILGLISDSYLYEVDPVTLAETLMTKLGFAYDDSVSIQGNDAPIQHDPAYNSGFIVGRANVSSVKRYDVINSGQLTVTTTKYNTAGAPVAQIDPLAHQRTIGYADSFSDGNNNRNTLAYATSFTDADGFTSTVQYNFNFGAVTRTQAPPPAGQTVGEIKNFTYDDRLRVLKVSLELGANSDYAHTEFEYPDSQTRIDIFETIQENRGEAHSFRIVDGHGRVFAIASPHQGSSTGFSGQLTLFDKLGLVIKSSNPTETNTVGTPTQWAAAGDDASWLYTQQTYDWQGRPLITTNPDLTTRRASYSGCGCAGGDTTTLTDEGTIDGGVAKRRQLKAYADVLGRTVKTELLNWENGSVDSTVVNTYNVRDQVIKVRAFAGPEGTGASRDTINTYDGYGRLKTQHLPEYDLGLTTIYDYNDDDTLHKVTDPRGTTATMSYNNRHLMTGIVYGVPAGSNIPVTAPVTFGYDSFGNRSSMTDGFGTMTYGYNQLSRMTSETRVFSDPTNTNINNVSRTLTYDYNQGGQIASIADGFGGVLNYDFDVLGRLNNLTGTGYPVSQFVTGMQYRAWNSLKSQTNGNGITESAAYNARLQLTGFEVRKPTNEISMSSVNQYYDDGELKFSDNLLERFDRAFTYDHSGRIKEALTGSEARDFINGTSGSTPTGAYRQTFQYNGFGEITQQIDRLWSQTTTTLSTFTNNRRDGWGYDQAGRLLSDDTTVYTRDAAGRITLKVGLGGVNTIKYDGNGQVIGTVLARPGPVGHSINIRKYFLRATPKNSLEVVELNFNGAKIKGFVYAGTRRIAETDINFVTWQHEDPVTSSKGESLSSGFFSASEEINAAGVNVGLVEPEPFDLEVPMPEPTLEGMNLFGGSSCSSSNPNCTTCYLDGMEHDCGQVMNLAAAGAVQIELRNSLGERRYADVEVILGVLYVPGFHRHTHGERTGAMVLSDPNNPNSPEVWDPNATVITQRIDFFQGAFIPFVTPSVFGQNFNHVRTRQNPPQNSDSIPNGCLEFVGIVQTFIDAANSERQFFDMLARTFTTAANSDLLEWRNNAGGLVLHTDRSRKVLSDNGIKPSLRIPGLETFSYVRHFVGGLVSSGRHGLAGLMFFADQEDGQTSEDSRVDRAINEVSFDLGISYFGPTTGSLARARGSLASEIRKRFCE